MVGRAETPRGAIRNPSQIARIRDFTGLRWGNITPTDIDGMVEYQNKAYVFFESKTGDAPLSFGQRLAFERLADDLAKVKPTLYLVLSVPEGAPEPVDYAKLAVVSSRRHGEWNDEYTGLTCKEAIDKFLQIGIG